ncbi:dATP pyrophosphohydrolase [Limibacillus halophilus]|uniref:GNAT superfamily N-acetyltransferase n=1 Tax=Limibacillus halophilus TaxID=1579333 RepID=A0A839T0A3_9PROT|nr:dATP pyrophosphohydrolase [Limibacillus halophilus]MBB3066583.1 GNAT superfamily N-acetyltransferase [Limibacillus halophilus]
MPHSEISVVPVANRRDLKRFVRLPARIMASDPNYIPQLTLERLLNLSPKHNPYFEHAEAAFWLAYRGEDCVGRISAQIDSIYLERYQDWTGHFGFLDAVDDPAVFAALFETAESWLKQRGMKRALGPFSLSINEETGLLIDGFDTPPYVMMGHAQPYYGPRVEEQGYGKAKDMVAYAYGSLNSRPPLTDKLVNRALRGVDVEFRAIDWKNFERDLNLIVDIFNDAWSGNWGFVPMTESEINNLAKTIKPIITPEFGCIAEIDGEAAAMVVTLPNINEAIRDFGGRLFPFNWVKLLWRLKVSGVESVRMPLMGVRQKYQSTNLGAALALGIIENVRIFHQGRGNVNAELGWVLEDNHGTHKIIEAMGAEIYKTYRVYEKDLL